MRRFFSLLLRLFPRAFRGHFGEVVVEHAVRDSADARSFAATTLDLLRAALAERLDPSWRDSHSERRKGEFMGIDMTGWGGELKLALRTLRRTPGFAATVIGTLGLAIGTLTGVFAVLDRVVLSPLPYSHADRLVFITATAPGTELKGEAGVGGEFQIQYKETSKLLEDVAMFGSFTSTMRTADRVERIRMGYVTSSMYSTLGARPAIGRLPVPSDEDRVAVISDSLFKTWFGSDPAVVGRTYDIAGSRRTVVGVMPPEFNFPNALLWIVGDVKAEGLQPGRFGNGMIGRMAPGTNPDAVASELTQLALRLPGRFGGTPGYARIIEKHRAVVRPLLDQILGPAARSLWVLFAAAGIVLLIACVNVANLFMVRTEGRLRDLAVRRAIGASSAQLVRLQMAEVTVAALAGGILAVTVIALGLPALLHAAPAGLPRLNEVSVGARSLFFALITAIAAGIACGAAAARRGASPDLGRLRESSRGSTGKRRFSRDALVVLQTAMALVLLIGSGLLMRSFVELRRVDPGYDTRDVFTFQFAPEQPSLRGGPAWARFHLDFMDRLRALPGVTTVGIVENIPLDEGTRTDRFRNEDMPEGPDAGVPLDLTFAGGDYFKAMAIRVVDGRPFEIADHVSQPGNVVISRTAAEQLFPGQRAVGRRLQQNGSKDWNTVIGVVADVIQYDYRQAPQALLYYPLAGPRPDSWSLSSPAYVLKTPRAEAIAPDVRALIREVAPEAPMYRVYTMAELAARSMIQLSFTLLTLGIVSALALFLGAIGLYGVLSCVVAERRREIGVRMALGASAALVRRMIVAEGTRVVMVGVALGLGAAFLATRAISGLLYGVGAVDIPTFVGMSAVMLAIGGLATYLPALRASRVDPCVSLRED
jgi:putative ABC transport system permease protein